VNEPQDLEAIKSRLVRAGYPRPGTGQPERSTRDVGREAQEARAELRDHIIEDIWALIDEVEALRRGSRGP
jgi:hypothetical protein